MDEMVDSATHDRAGRIIRTPEDLIALAEREPTNPVPLYQLAIALRRRGDPCWHHAVAAASERPHITPQQVYGRALAKITFGDWSGWRDYNTRFAAPNMIREYLAEFGDIFWKHQEWDGNEALTDKSLLVLPEQGYGDCLQMWRFIPTLIESAGTVIVMTYPGLIPLARHNFGSRAKIWMAKIKPTQPFDRYVWSMSLPAAVGYLPDFQPLMAPGRRTTLPARTRTFRAGICWAGYSEYERDPERSTHLADLAPLLERSDIEWHALQVGPRAGEAIEFPLIIPPRQPLVTFGDTADLIRELDFVVSVDTSVCHLAGLMGIPTYILTEHASNWRWGLDDVTPWYPSVRVIRQPAPGDWAGTVDRLNQLLDVRCGCRVAPALA